MTRDSIELKFDISGKIEMPHLSYGKVGSASKHAIASDVLARKNEDVLLINSTGFNVCSVFAGLAERHIEHIANYAPKEYKKEIIDLLSNIAEVEDIFRIAKLLDEDLGNNSTKNQERVKNIIQYVKDNKIVFEF